MIALIAAWLVFSLVRKIFGLVFLAAIGLCAWFVWSNPETAQDILASAAGFFQSV